MACRLVGWPEDDPRLELDYRAFAYAGKFGRAATGKAVLEDDGELVAAVSFSRDRTDDDRWWLRTVTVREDRRGEGLGPRLLDFAAERLLERGREVRIAVNNPFAYEAAYKAGFAFTGETTGLAELVCERPGERTASGYRAGLERFRARASLSDDEAAFLDDRSGSVPPLVGGPRVTLAGLRRAGRSWLAALCRPPRCRR